MNAPGGTPRREIAWGLLGMVALVSAIELREFRDNDAFVGQVAASWRYTGRVVGKKSRGKGILCFGDSMLKNGVLPRVVAARTGGKVYNLALQGGSAPSSYFLLRRALEAKARPSAIVVDFSRQILSWDPASSVTPLPWADLLTPGEAVELCREARDPDLLASILVQGLLASDRYRYEVRSHVLACLKDNLATRIRTPRVYRRNWAVNDGGQANPKAQPFTEAVIPPGIPPLPGTWRCHPVNAAYLRRFLDLASRHQIPVYWLLPPVTPGTQSVWEHQGEESLYDDFIREHLRRTPNLTVIDGRHANFPSRVFMDGVHLDHDGAVSLSVALGEALTSAGTASNSRTRWIKLPEFAEPPARFAVEDLDQSLIATERNLTTIRR
jgi:hypothetical protein